MFTLGVRTLHLDGVRAHGRVHVEAVAHHDDGARAGRDGRHQVGRGDPAAVLGLHAARRGVVHLLAAYRPADLGRWVRVVRRACQRHHVAHAGLGRPVDDHVRRRDCMRRNEGGD